MRIRWWQSIRWRLALGSMLVALLATVLLTLSVILAIVYYYGVDQRQRLTSLAADKAESIGESYTQSNDNLYQAANNTLPHGLVQSFQGEQYLLIVLNHRNQTLYPHYPTLQSVVRAFIVALDDPSLQRSDFSGLSSAIRNGQQGISSVGNIGQGAPGIIPRPFVVQPIFLGGQSNAPVVGVLVIVSRSAAENTIPPFVAAVGEVVLIAAAIVAVLAALAAILFARTITRPLAKLTNAAHELASGDFSAQVTVKAYGELDELANTFNKMAAKLANDMNELRRQELLRRELIMNITHDLATPLTAIAGLGESLVDGVNQDREDFEATGRIIVRETLRLRRLVQDLHLMAKVEAGAMQPQPKVLRLAAVVDETLAVLGPEFERVNVEPLNNVAFDLPPAWADPDMLMRVFSNLCDNALRHTPNGGTIVIEARQQGKMLEITVTDTGRGIPPEALSRVFDRFYRADSSRQVRTGGSGLGLTIVRAIVEAHGGTIRAENAPQGGARFMFSLPIAEQAPVWSYITTPI